ncbi:replicative DNA helicase [Rhizobium leguminosarum]|uniref:Replicative DNA helicase n=1 Tax=Rhizobium leguminosarum TaxID=384 RepID=A0A7W9ZUU5_RHILE|nr:DNA helicase [Rhizobium leguminosarum]MBB6223235.1 replicative DNA helicase [Rhizobium leguminosarum]NYJ13964.1 replicative DNA helicase [Rhizobium leguminosarum]
MKLSAPLFQLKRRAKLMARNNNVPLHEALDQIAREEGFPRWSLLSSHIAAASLSETILSRLNEGDLLLLAGRPGHGKTTLGLQLLLDAARDNRKAIFFTLELTEQQARKHIRSLEKDTPGIGDTLEVVTSDEISADFIVRHLSGSKRGTVAVIDYLQLLDQQRSKPVLSEQVLTLGDFARKAGIVIGFISQIDRSFDPERKKLPDIHDIRLPNLVDLGLFTKACFLHNGEAQLQDVA